MLAKISGWITGTESKISFAQQLIGFLGWLGIIGIGTAASSRAAMTDWLAAYGPAGWIIFGVGIALAAAVAFWVISLSIGFLATARLNLSYANRSGFVNPLKTSFDGEIINVSDFYAPGPMIYRDKIFRKCQFRGPGAIYVGARSTGLGRMEDCGGHVSVIETIDPIIDSSCTIIFLDSVFIECSFYRVTFVGPPGLRNLLSNIAVSPTSLNSGPRSPVNTEEETRP